MINSSLSFFSDAQEDYQRLRRKFRNQKDGSRAYQEMIFICISPNWQRMEHQSFYG